MSVLFAYTDEAARYDLGPEHPFRPERFTLAVDLMRAYGLLPGSPAPAPHASRVKAVQPEPLDRVSLELVHDTSYIETVIAAGADPTGFAPRRGIGPGDTPAFRSMHDAALMACGATTRALRAIVEGETRRSMSIAGGLHHAHRDRAAGFCVYNDLAVAIEVLRRDHPGLRVAYVDVDAHHGDGVQEIFYEDPDVLTISVHESGRYLYPGTGRVVETGKGAGQGFAINVPLPPYADDTAYRLVARYIIAPALAAFAPDAVIAQCGADALHTDPLTHLGLTLSGYRDLVTSIIAAADASCDGRICVTGGGGYDTYSGVPRAWTCLLAALLGVDLPDELPQAWRTLAEETSGLPAPALLMEDSFHPLPGVAEAVHAETSAVVERVRQASPLLAREPDEE